MARTLYLTESEKQIGLKHMLRDEMFNGISYNLLGGTFVYLIAVYFNAGSFALGYISSVLYIAGAVLPLVPKMFNKKNIVKVQSYAWLFRGLVSFLYVGLIFLDRKYAITFLLVIYTLFSIFRVIGIALNDFTVKSLSTSSNLGRVVGNINMAYQSSAIIVCCLAAVYLDIVKLPGIMAIVILQVIGAILNTFSANEIAKIPCRRTINYRKGQGLFVIFKQSMKNEIRRRRLILRWLSSALVVGFGMVVPFLKIYVGLDNSSISFYTAACSISSLLAGLVNKQLSDRLGSKPICLISSIIFLLFLIAWAISPITLSITYFFLLGVFSNFFLLISYFSVFRLISAVIPDKDAISFNSMNNFAIAILAFITGIINGFLANIEILQFIPASKFFNNYSLMFIFLVLLNFIFIFYSARLKEVGAYSSSQTAKILLSRHGIQAISKIERLDRTFDPYKRRLLLFSLGTNTNTLATSQLKTILATPFSIDKKEIVRSLAIRPRKALLPSLISLAGNNDESTQIEAIVALGSYKNNEMAIEALTNLLHSRWGSVRSVASKSLSIISKDDSLLPVIMELSLKATHIDEEVDYLIAKKNLDKEGQFFENFFVSVSQKRGPTYRQTRYAVLASFLHFGSPVLSNMFGRINLGDYNAVIEDFLTDAQDVDIIFSNYDEILKAFLEYDFNSLKEFSLELLNSCENFKDTRMSHIRKGLLKVNDFDLSDFDLQDIVALFYFSYSLANNSK
jgi:MFS family permease